MENQEQARNSEDADKEVMARKPWESKTLWTAVISIAALAIQSKTGFVVSPELQAYSLIIVNCVLRFVTKDPISW